jgi:hypothetical protein
MEGFLSQSLKNLQVLERMTKPPHQTNRDSTAAVSSSQSVPDDCDKDNDQDDTAVDLNATSTSFSQFPKDGGVVMQDNTVVAHPVSSSSQSLELPPGRANKAEEISTYASPVQGFTDKVRPSVARVTRPVIVDLDSSSSSGSSERQKEPDERVTSRQSRGKRVIQSKVPTKPTSRKRLKRGSRPVANLNLHTIDSSSDCEDEQGSPNFKLGDSGSSV